MYKLPTLEDVLREQENLDILCADRELSTKEIFFGNAFYGNDFILKLYTGLPKNYALKFIIPHGIVFSQTHIWEAEEKNVLPVTVCYQRNRYDLYKSRLNKKIIVPFAAPYIYIPYILKSETISNRKGTIFFPAHSTHHVTASMNYEQLTEILTNLDSRYHPVTICMYWRDVNLKCNEYFQKKGFHVVSAGHIFDNMFLFRLYRLCSQYKFSMSNQAGSHLFYSQYAGCDNFVINSEKITYLASKEVLERDVAVGSNSYEEIMNLFLFEKNKRLKDDVVKEYLGISFKKERHKLIIFMIYCELLYTLAKIKFLR